MILLLQIRTGHEPRHPSSRVSKRTRITTDLYRGRVRARNWREDSFTRTILACPTTASSVGVRTESITTRRRIIHDSNCRTLATSNGTEQNRLGLVFVRRVTFAFTVEEFWLLSSKTYYFILENCLRGIFLVRHAVSEIEIFSLRVLDTCCTIFLNNQKASKR